MAEPDNGKEAVESYRRRPADLLITDFIMPEKEGIETIIQLRESYPKVKQILSPASMDRSSTPRDQASVNEITVDIYLRWRRIAAKLRFAEELRLFKRDLATDRF